MSTGFGDIIAAQPRQGWPSMPGHLRISDDISSPPARPVLVVLRPGEEARPPTPPPSTPEESPSGKLVRRSQPHSSLWPHGSRAMDGSGRMAQVRASRVLPSRGVTGSWGFLRGSAAQSLRGHSEGEGAGSSGS